MDQGGRFGGFAGSTLLTLDAMLSASMPTARRTAAEFRGGLTSTPSLSMPDE